jgi:hypothetical protein
LKDGDLAVWLVARRRDECDSGSRHPLVGGIEVVNPKKQPYSACDLIANDSLLALTVSTGEQDSSFASHGTNHDPPLAAAVIGQGRRVFHDLETEGVYEKSDGRVVVLHNKRDERKIRHEATRLPEPAWTAALTFGLKRSMVVPTSRLNRTGLVGGQIP